MKPISHLILFSFLSCMLFSSVSYAAKVPLPYNKKIRTTIKNIESYGDYVVVHLSRDVENTANCLGPVFDGFDDSTITGVIKSFYLDVTTAKGKAMFASVLTAAAARKKTEFTVTSCDQNTNLPIIDVVSTLY